MAKVNSVLYNVNQDFPETGDASKQRARNNIGAASQADLTAETNRAVLAEKAAKTEVAQGSGMSVSSSTGTDGQTIYTVAANIPDATQSASGLMSATDKTKLDGIQSGAQVNVIETVKVNGTAQTVTSKAVDISVPTKTSQLTNDSGFITASDVPQEVEYVDSSNTFADVKAIVDAGHLPVYVVNTIPTGPSGYYRDRYVMSSYHYSESQGRSASFSRTAGNTVATYTIDGSTNQWTTTTTTIPAAQVNSDWNATTGVEAILNKPTLGSLASKNAVTDSDISGTISDTHIASASTWNAKQNALPTTGTATQTYSISINGNAASATNASYATYGANGTNIESYFTANTQNVSDINTALGTKQPLCNMYIDGTNPSSGTAYTDTVNAISKGYAPMLNVGGIYLPLAYVSLDPNDSSVMWYHFEDGVSSTNTAYHRIVKPSSITNSDTTGIAHFVSYDANQGLSTANQDNARKNINAFESPDMTNAQPWQVLRINENLKPTLGFAPEMYGGVYDENVGLIIGGDGDTWKKKPTIKLGASQVGSTVTDNVYQIFAMPRFWNLDSWMITDGYVLAWSRVEYVKNNQKYFDYQYRSVALSSSANKHDLTTTYTGFANDGDSLHISLDLAVYALRSSAYSARTAMFHVDIFWGFYMSSGVLGDIGYWNGYSVAPCGAFNGSTLIWPVEN